MTERIECSKCRGIMLEVRGELRCCDCNGKKVATDEDAVMAGLWADLKGRAGDKSAPAKAQQFILE